MLLFALRNRSWWHSSPRKINTSLPRSNYRGQSHRSAFNIRLFGLGSLRFGPLMKESLQFRVFSPRFKRYTVQTAPQNTFGKGMCGVRVIKRTDAFTPYNQRSWTFSSKHSMRRSKGGGGEEFCWEKFRVGVIVVYGSNQTFTLCFVLSSFLSSFGI